MKQLLILFFLVPACLSAQDTTTVFPVYSNKLYYNRKNNTELFTGVCVSYYKDTISRTVEFKNGVLVKTADFYSNGKLRSSVEHKGDLNVKDGHYIMYYKNGNKQMEAVFSENLADSVNTEWHENGTLSSRCNYIKGKAEGLSESYFDNGQLKEKGNTTKGHRAGTWEEYYYNGNEKSEGPYQTIGYSGNCKTGLWTFWYESGQKKMEIDFEKPFDEGMNESMLMTNYMPYTQYVIHNFWEPDGTQTVIEGTGRAVLYGKYSEDENAVSLTAYFIKGKRAGTWIMKLYDECVKMLIPFNDKGNLDGKISVLHCDGNPQWVYNYADGTYVNREAFEKTY